MLKKFKDVKVDVTVDGSGFDNPTELTIEDDGEIPLCNMIFPGGVRSRYRIQGTDVVKVYIGLDELPEYPTFVGYQVNESGLTEARMEFSGALFKATKDYRRVINTDNLDGYEIGAAIRKIFDSVNELSWLTPIIEKTNPAVYVPYDDIRYDKGISKHELMRDMRDIAVDALDPIHLGRYTFFVHGDSFYFRRVPDPKTSSAWLKIAYGDTLLSLEQDGGSGFGINRVTVIGKDDVFAEFENDNRVGVDGLLEESPINDSSILGDGDAYEIARAKVMESMIPEVPLMIASPLLLEGIPNITVLELTGAPYGLADNYLLKSKTISISEGMFEVMGTVSTPVDVVSEAIAQVLGLNRDLPLTSTPAGTPTSVGVL